MKDFKDIEELFRENLGGFEADPGPGAWDAIQQNLQSTASTTSSGGAAATSKISLIKLVAGVAIVSTGIGLTAGYFYSENKHEKAEAKKEAEKTVLPEKTEELSEEISTSDSEETGKYFNQNDPSNTDKELKTKPELHSDKTVIKDKAKQKTYIVSVKEKTIFNSSLKRSASDSWITKNNVFDYPATNTVGNDKETNDDPVTETVSIIKETDINKPVANIERSSSGGPAPLTVTFSSGEKNHSYEWIFSDVDDVMTSQTATHTFVNPGEYSVVLVVKDDKGNISKDEVMIKVTEPVAKENKLASKLVTNNVNVISPNNDGANDELFFTHQNLESFVFMVMDRQGGKIYYQTTDPDFKWNGTKNNGDLMEEGTYIYYFKAKGKDEQDYSGQKTITIVR